MLRGLANTMNDSLLKTIKKNRKNTNCYYSLSSISDMIQKGIMDFYFVDDIVLLFENHEKYHKLYYFLSGSKPSIDLKNQLTEELEKYDLVTADIITRNIKNNLYDLFFLEEILGFVEYQKYVRKNCKEPKVTNCKKTLNLCNAGQIDIKTIHSMMLKNFDYLTSTLPSLGELEKMIENSQVIKAVFQDDIAGYLIYEHEGVKSYLRNICVNKNYRNNGIAKQLITKYVEIESFKTDLFFLWVESSNKEALSLYEKLGYENDGLLDYIFIKNS